MKIKTVVEQKFTKLLLSGLPRCLISWLLIGAFYLSLWAYKDRILSPRSKSSFDAITVALSIAFGLNIASALKTVALDLRWWILSIGKRPSKEVYRALPQNRDTNTDHLLLITRLNLSCIVIA